ncbi:MAG: DUF309 domain-containing protein [Candidatus Solibacter sp.]
MDPLLVRGLQLFNHGEYFESHEAWEEAWTPQRGPRRLFLQALIHFAVALYHAERANTAGACRQLRKGLHKLAAYRPTCESIDTARLHREGSAVLAALEAGTPFEPPRVHLV